MSYRQAVAESERRQAERSAERGAKIKQENDEAMKRYRAHNKRNEEQYRTAKEAKYRAILSQYGLI